MNNNFKCITNYNPNDFTYVEIEIIDDINLNVLDFINVKTFNDFCKGKTYSPPSIDKLAKKLGYKTALDFKNAVMKIYYEKINIINKFHFDNLANKNISPKRIESLKEHLNNSALSLFDVDWNIVEELEKEIIKRKNIYILNSDNLFSNTSFEILCSLFDKNIIKIESEFRLNHIIQFGIQEDSILLISKMYFNYENKEDTSIKIFKNKNIPIFVISADEAATKHDVKKITIGNFSQRINNTSLDIANYKIIYDQLLNIINYDIFEGLLSKKK